MGIRLLLLLLMFQLAQTESWSNHFVANSSIDIVFVLDRSSNVANYVHATENLVLNLVSKLDYSKTRIAVVVYRTEAEVVFTDLKQRRRRRWCQLENALKRSRGTEGYSALTSAFDIVESLLLESTSSEKSVILLTGSDANVGISPLNQVFRLKSLVWARDGRERGVDLHVLGYHSADRNTLKAVVAPHSGRLRWFTDTAALSAFAAGLKPDPACARELHFPDDVVTKDDSVISPYTEPLAAFTVCLWTRPSGRNANLGTLFAYTKVPKKRGRVRDANLITLSKTMALQIQVNNDPVSTDVSLSARQWHHVCITWQNTNWHLYVNGTARKSGSGLADSNGLGEGGRFELGQSARLPSGRQDTSRSFHGTLSQVQVYSRALPPSSISVLARPATPCTSYPRADVIQWTDFLDDVEGSMIAIRPTKIGSDFDWCPPPIGAECKSCAISERCWTNQTKTVCECDQNGQLCRTEYSKCADRNYCQNGGVCLLDKAGDPQCLCGYGYRGDRCEIGACEKCQNGGTCHGKKCNCPSLFLGPQCEVKLKPSCEHKPCVSGNGTCSLDTNGYHCQCENKDLGSNCQVRSTCDDRPCPDGAICIKIGQGHVCLGANETETTPSAATTESTSLGKVVQKFNVVLRLEMDWSEELEEDEDFKKTFANEVKKLCKSLYSGKIDVIIKDIRSGSVVVDFDIAFHQKKTGEQSASDLMSAGALEQAFKTELRDGGFGPYNATTTGLAVQEIEVSGDPGALSEAELGMILGGTLLAAVLIVVCTVIVCMRIRHQNEFEHMSHRTKSAIGYDLTELSSPIARSTPKPISPSPVASLFHRWSTRGQRTDTLQQLMNSPENKDTLTREQVITIEVHDNLGFEPDSLSQQSFGMSSRREHTSLATRPPPLDDQDDLSEASSDTMKADDTAALDDSDFDSSIGEFDYNEELARSLKELDRVCSEENLTEIPDDLQTPSGAFSLRREEIITNIDDVELSDEADKNSPQSPMSNDDCEADSKFPFVDHVIPDFEVIPTLELPPDPRLSIVSSYRTYSEQQRSILSCFERQTLQYF